MPADISLNTCIMEDFNIIYKATGNYFVHETQLNSLTKHFHVHARSSDHRYLIVEWTFWCLNLSCLDT